jgi:predicted nucleic acid-binding protein
VRFWDSSALVPLCIEQPQSRACRDAYRADRRVVVWSLTRTEVISALCRQHHAGGVTDAALRASEARLDLLSAQWDEVDALALVRDEADRLLHLHRLRAADALQLGAALLAVDRRPRRRIFVTLDAELRVAADREGFQTIAPGQR